MSGTDIKGLRGPDWSLMYALKHQAVFQMEVLDRNDNFWGGRMMQVKGPKWQCDANGLVPSFLALNEDSLATL